MELKNIKKELRFVRMGDLKPFPGNPRHNNKSAKMVAKSISEYGYINPIVVNDDLVILAGNTRFKALKILGLKDDDVIDVLVVSGLSEHQENGFVIIDNRVGEYSTWNQAAISRMMEKENVKSDVLKDMGVTSVTDNKHELENLINGI